MKEKENIMAMKYSAIAMRVLAPCVLIVAVMGVFRGFFQGNGSMIPTAFSQVLEQVGLKDRMGNFPAQLSGGEQQRVAIARALAKNPKLLLCDEPTGALDYNTGKAILKLLQDTCRQSGMTVIIITHNKALCDMADRVIRVKSGTIRSVQVNENATPVEQIEW